MKQVETSLLTFTIYLHLNYSVTRQISNSFITRNLIEMILKRNQYKTDIVPNFIALEMVVFGISWAIFFYYNYVMKTRCIIYQGIQVTSLNFTC